MGGGDAAFGPHRRRTGWRHGTLHTVKCPLAPAHSAATFGELGRNSLLGPGFFNYFRYVRVHPCGI